MSKIVLDESNSVDPDQTPRCAASDLGLHCLLRIVLIFRVITVSLLPYVFAYTDPSIDRDQNASSDQSLHRLPDIFIKKWNNRLCKNLRTGMVTAHRIICRTVHLF